MVQWLKLCTTNAGGPGSVLGQGTGSHMLQLRVHMLQLKIVGPVCCNYDPVHQINKYFKKKEKWASIAGELVNLMYAAEVRQKVGEGHILGPDLV